jgi:branched-chain amino acid transport system ATP-binding protein
MLSLARALAVDTRFVIVDEPSLGLAPKLVDMVLDSLETAKQSGLTLIAIEQAYGRLRQAASDRPNNASRQ